MKRKLTILFFAVTLLATMVVTASAQYRRGGYVVVNPQYRYQRQRRIYTFPGRGTGWQRRGDFPGRGYGWRRWDRRDNRWDRREDRGDRRDNRWDRQDNRWDRRRDRRW